MSNPEQPIPVFIVAGLTGSGKTELIQHLKLNQIQAIDIESMCRHDGSVFARLKYPSQPSSYLFHKQLLKEWSSFDPERPVFIESELKKLGRITLPDWLYSKMLKSPVIWLDTIKSLRIERISAFIRQSNPINFCNCLSKLNLKLGDGNLDLAMKYFQNKEMEQLAEILLAYYDKAPGYNYPAERVVIKLPVTNNNIELTADAMMMLVDKLPIKSTQCVVSKL